MPQPSYSFLVPDTTSRRPLRCCYAIISVLMIVNVLLAAIKTYRHFFMVWDINDHRYSELLINFQGGFVRRGLIGEAIFQFCQMAGVSPVGVIRVLCLSAFLFVLGFFIYKFYVRKLNWWILCTPFLFGMLDELIRKDFICYALIILLCLCLRQCFRREGWLPLLAVIGLLGLMVHEAFIFFGLPVVTLLLLRHPGRPSAARWLIPLLWIAAFLLLCVFKGNREVVCGIVSSWQDAFPDLGVSDESQSIKALRWTLQKAANFHLGRNFNPPSIGLWAIPVRIAFLFATYYFITNFFYYFKGKSRFDESKRTLISTLFIFSFVCLLPMFTVLSVDFGRVYQYLFMAVLIPMLTIRSETLAAAFGDRVLAKIGAFNRHITAGPIVMKLIVLAELLALGDAVFYFNPMWGFMQTAAGKVYYVISYFV